MCHQDEHEHTCKLVLNNLAFNMNVALIILYFLNFFLLFCGIEIDI